MMTDIRAVHFAGMVRIEDHERDSVEGRTHVRTVAQMTIADAEKLSADIHAAAQQARAQRRKAMIDSIGPMKAERKRLVEQMEALDKRLEEACAARAENA